jgi:hypothetical protein
MKFDLQNKIIIGVFCFLALLLVVGSGQAASADVSGWNFTMNLDGWRTENSIVPYDSSSPEWKPTCEVGGTWIGVTSTGFVYPSFPNATEGQKEHGLYSGWANIFVFKIPDDLRKLELKDILSYATRNAVECNTYNNEKDITFDGHKARLSEGDFDSGSDFTNIKLSNSAIAILLDDDTVGLIEVSVIKEPREIGDTIFNGRAWDVIEKFTISPK